MSLYNVRQKGYIWLSTSKAHSRLRYSGTRQSFESTSPQTPPPPPSPAKKPLNVPFSSRSHNPRSILILYSPSPRRARYATMRIHGTGPKILRVPDVVPRSVIDVGFLRGIKQTMLAFLKPQSNKQRPKAKLTPLNSALMLPVLYKDLRVPCESAM